MYYRLYDRQCGRHMATGYNAKSQKKLISAFCDYQAMSWEWSEEEIKSLQSLPKKQALAQIESFEFTVEKQETPFEDFEWEIESIGEAILEIGQRRKMPMYNNPDGHKLLDDAIRRVLKTWVK